MRLSDTASCRSSAGTFPKPIWKLQFTGEARSLSGRPQCALWGSTLNAGLSLFRWNLRSIGATSPAPIAIHKSHLGLRSSTLHREWLRRTIPARGPSWDQRGRSSLPPKGLSR
jgi:hypothetical protein